MGSSEPSAVLASPRAGAIGAQTAPGRSRLLVWVLPVCLLVLAALAIFWWRARAQKTQYITAAVTRGPIQRSVSMTGALNPVVTVQVGSYVSGTIKSLGCDFNTEVVVGQVCAVIDPVPFQLIVDQDRAEVQSGVAQLKKDEAALVYAKLAYARDSKLLGESSVSQDTVDSDKSTLDQADAQVGVDKASIVDKQATLKAAEVNLAYTNIVSPVIGTVITRAIDVGQTVAASLSSPTLFLIGKDLTHMQVDTNVSEADIGEVKLGQETNFTVQAFPGRTFRGNVTQIRKGPITVQNVVTYDVVVAVPNEDRALFPGMTADTHIVIDEHDDVLRVPLPAVRFNPEGIKARDESESRRERHGEKSEGEDGSASSGSSASAGSGSSESPGPSGNPGAGNGEHRHRDHGDGTGEHAGRREHADGGVGEHGGHREHGEGNGARAEHHSQVWVLGDNGELRPVRVTVGLDDGALVEVSSDELKPGDKVVVNEANTGERKNGAAPMPGQFRPGGGGGPRL